MKTKLSLWQANKYIESYKVAKDTLHPAKWKLESLKIYAANEQGVYLCAEMWTCFMFVYNFGDITPT